MSSVPHRLQLYFAPGTSSRVSLIALAECGVPYETSLVKLMAGEHRSPAYLAINPRGKVPTLLVDGEPLAENVAILTFLARTYPGARLLPLDGTTFAQSKVLAELAWCAATVHPIVTRLRLPFIFAEGQQGIDSVWQTAARAMAPNFAWIEQRLEGQPWWLGTWSIIDAFLFWIWTQVEEAGFDVSPYPHFADLIVRIRQLPSVQDAMAREAEAFATLEQLGLAPKFSPGAPVS